MKRAITTYLYVLYKDFAVIHVCLISVSPQQQEFKKEEEALGCVIRESV